MMTLGAAVYVFMYLLIGAAILWLLWWLIDYASPPEPIKKGLHIALACLAVLVIIGLLLGLLGHGPIVFHGR